MLKKYIICHYSEIGLKGKNRHLFEQKLIDNIKLALSQNAPGSFFDVQNTYGRIIIKLSEKYNEKKIKTTLQNVCGLANFSFTLKIKPDINEIQKACYEIMSLKKFTTFRITTLRSDKNFKLTSQEINEKIGRYIEAKLHKKVKLKNSGSECFIEITNKTAFIYLKKIPAVGGLPVGISGKAAVLLSGGIDSPVAAFYTNKRGVKNIFVHFHSAPYTSRDSIDKVKELVKILNKFQYNSTLYLVPFANIQKQIIANTPSKFRVILYRRFMMRIAEVIACPPNCASRNGWARKERYKALVTGESLGQVASQTIENITAVQDAVDIPILRPLIGFDKNEIIKKAREIGTYNISILPHDDCCTRFMPKDPETKAKLEEVNEAEKKLPVEKMVNEAIKKIIIVKGSDPDASKLDP